MVISPAPAAVAACDEFDVIMLRVDEEAGAALTLERHGGGGSGRTRWTYLKYLPQHLLATLQEGTIRKSNEMSSTQDGNGGETEGERDTSPGSSSPASDSITPAWQAVASEDDLLPMTEDDENKLIAETLLGLQEGVDIGMEYDHGRENYSISKGCDVGRRIVEEGVVGVSSEEGHRAAERAFDDAALDGDTGGDKRIREPAREQDSAGRWSDLGAFNSTFHSIEDALQEAIVQVAGQHKNDQERRSGETSDGPRCVEDAAIRNNGGNFRVEEVSLKSGGSLVEQDSPNIDDEHQSSVTQAVPQMLMRGDEGEDGVRSRTSLDAHGPDGSRPGGENLTDQLDETTDRGLRSNGGHSYSAGFETKGGVGVGGGRYSDGDGLTDRIAEPTGESTDQALYISDSSSSSSWTVNTPPPRTSSSRHPTTPCIHTPCATGFPAIDSPSSGCTILELRRGEALAGEDACHDADKRLEFDVSPSSSKLPPVPPTCRGSASPVPTITSPWMPRTTVRGIEIKKSDANLACRGGGMTEGAGWGAFCEGHVAQGDVVFEEEALLSVDPRDVEGNVWRVVYTAAHECTTADVSGRVASGGVQTNNIGLHPVELLQAVAWDNADAAVQDRVLQLFTPEPDSFPKSQLAAWDAALESMEQRHAFKCSGDICVPTSTNQVAACSGGANGTRAGDKKCDRGRMKNENENRRDHSGIKRRGGKAMADQSEVGCGRTREKRRSDLLRVLMVCEANIFGEEEPEPDHERRFLFETACRINHSCLPNCTYTIRDGRMTVRALIDLSPGAELSISYLPFDIIMRDTDTRRDFLLSKKYFWCNCSRCSSKHDLARAFRCPFCHKGAVYPATVACQASHTVAVEGESSRAGSNCAAPGTTACESAAVGSAPAVGFEPAFGSQAFGVSACTDCGRVPTASWLASALRLEIFVLQALEETFAFDDSRAAHAMPYICAVGMYLFDEHHLRAECHDLMAELLQHLGRFEEAAYHLHEALRIWDAILHRPSRKVGQLLHALGICLSIITGIQQAQLERPLFSMQPSPGRCGTFAGLVQNPAPASMERHALDGEAEQTHGNSNASVDPAGSARDNATVACDMAGCALNNDADRSRSEEDAGFGGSGCGDDGVMSPGYDEERISIQGGVCATCGRRHGRPCDIPPDFAAQQDAVEEDDWAVQVSGCARAFRRAMDVFSTIYGEDGRETLQAREHTIEIQKIIASQKAQLGHT